MAYQTRGRDPMFDTETALMLERRGAEAIGLGLVLFGLALAAMLLSYAPEDPSWFSATEEPVQNWLGRFGATLADPMYRLFGRGTWALPVLAIGWGLRFILHRAERQRWLSAVYAPFWLAFCAIYASGLQPTGDWDHPFGLGGLFGDMAMGTLLSALPLPPAIALKLAQLLMGAVILWFGSVVLGFTRPEVMDMISGLRQGLRRLLGLAGVMAGQGVSGAAQAARSVQAHRAERRANRAEVMAAERAEADHLNSYGQPVHYSAPDYADPYDDDDAPLVEDDMTPVVPPRPESFSVPPAPAFGAVPPAPQPAMTHHAPLVQRAPAPMSQTAGQPVGQPAGAAAPVASPVAPQQTSQQVPHQAEPQDEPRGGLINRLRIARNEPLYRPDADGIVLEETTNVFDEEEGARPDAISAKITSAVRNKLRDQTRPSFAAPPEDPHKPLTRGRGHGPRPLVFNPAPPAPAGLPPEPPLTAAAMPLRAEPPLTGAAPEAAYTPETYASDPYASDPYAPEGYPAVDPYAQHVSAMPDTPVPSEAWAQPGRAAPVAPEAPMPQAPQSIPGDHVPTEALGLPSAPSAGYAQAPRAEAHPPLAASVPVEDLPQSYSAAVPEMPAAPQMQAPAFEALPEAAMPDEAPAADPRPQPGGLRAALGGALSGALAGGLTARMSGAAKPVSGPVVQPVADPGPAAEVHARGEALPQPRPESAMPDSALPDTAQAPRPAPQTAPQPTMRQAAQEAGPVYTPPETPFELPPLDLLMNPDQVERHHLPDEVLEQNARQLEEVLGQYGVKGEITSVRPGPVVTMYELEPAPGLKASRVIGLADDIARSMEALSARVSTVPGRSVIGIELPNAHRETVPLREVLDSRDYAEGAQTLPLALGKDIGGAPIVANLAKMPHLLIAGTTGSGKSVAINTMILSLLYKLTPEECRLIMIDPKMLELSVYDGIPHLLSPVVTDPKKALVALKWTVGEMEDRYRKMSKMGVRNIAGYNSRVEDALSRGEMFSRVVQTGFDDETGEPVFETEEFEPKTMPYIVVIVDEMADLMMVAGKEIEACIQRLAQMARASGIHLIMATQRPSVDVITGTIKANFPTRISFQVTSKIDSRTILGEMGAEQLLGMGDMLYMGSGSRVMRCHGPFVSDEEVEEIVTHLKAFGPPSYVSGVVEGPDDEKTADIDAVLGLNTGGNTGGEDALYDQAVAIVIKDRKCSTSYIQRKLGIGYNKAARLVEQMEDEGVVSSANHVGKREILVPEQ